MIRFYYDEAAAFSLFATFLSLIGDRYVAVSAAVFRCSAAVSRLSDPAVFSAGIHEFQALGR